MRPHIPIGPAEHFQIEWGQVSALGTSLKVRSHGLLSGMRQAALYCDWLSRPSLARQRGDQMVGI